MVKIIMAKNGPILINGRVQLVCITLDSCEKKPLSTSAKALVDEEAAF